VGSHDLHPTIPTKKSGTNKKPPAALADGGLFGARFKRLFCQAPIPARALWPLIRMAGAIIALAQGICMTLKQVDQSGMGRVKSIACG
jgi:hypothetical protein